MARIGTRVTRIKNADLYAGLMSDMPTDSFECELGLRPGSSSARVPEFHGLPYLRRPCACSVT